MSAAFGLALLPLVGLLVVATGCPAFAALIVAAGLGAIVTAASGDAALLGALPGRLFGLLESDLLQALPLFVLMGALLDRLPLVEILFRTASALLGRGPAARRVAALGLGTLLAPMSGSVGASVAMLSRSVGPRLARAGVAPADAFATVAVASTLGVVVPPSLVLILLGDALLNAHTIALTVTGRSDRVVNTQDIFSGVLGPAALFLALAVAAAAWPRRGEGAASSTATPAEAAPRRPGARDLAVSAATIAFVGLLLGGVATGRFYAVEAAATGAVALLAGGLASRRLGLAALGEVLSVTIAVTGALFALLVAATTFTLVLRGLGTDRLVLDAVAAVPAGERTALLAVMAVLALSSIVLDAFEIIFVVVPLVMPGLLVRVEDATWAAAVTLLTLQASFLLPPLGYAFTMARATMADPPPLGPAIRALAPYLAAAAIALGATIALPGLAHLAGGPPTRTDAPLTPGEVQDRLRDLMPDLPALGPIDEAPGK